MIYLFYNNVSQDHWIGRGGLEKWPPRSTSLTPYDLFLGGLGQVLNLLIKTMST